MKRFVLIILMLVMAISLLGCSKVQQSSETDGTTPPFSASMTMPFLYEETQEGS